MKIVLNGREEFLPAPVSLYDLVAGKGLDPDTVVVELNGALLAREAWAGTLLKDGDRVEILRFLGGG